MPKFKPVSIKQLLRIGQIDDDELAAVFTSVLPRGAQFTANEVEYRTSERRVGAESSLLRGYRC